MNRIVVFALVLGVSGLVVGYLIFGKIAGEYVSLSALFKPADNLLSQIGQAVTGIADIRRNVLISGAVGVGVGILAGAFLSRR